MPSKSVVIVLMNVTTWTSQKLHDLELSATCVGHFPLTGQCDNKGATGSWRDLLLADLQTLDSLNSARNTGETASRRYSTWKDEQSPSQLKFFPNSCGGGGPSGEDRNLDPLNLSRRKNLLGGLLPQEPLSLSSCSRPFCLFLLSDTCIMGLHPAMRAQNWT